MKVFYHAACNDGAGAAYAAWLALGDGAEYIPVQHGSKPPDIEPGEDVYILDFSWPTDVLAEIAGIAGCRTLGKYAGRKAGDITLIDHHKTALESLTHEFLEAYSIFAVLDDSKSGAVLTWEYFHKKKPVPKLLLHIQDRDLWKFELPFTKEIHRGLEAYPDWRRHWGLFCDEASLYDLAEEGDSIIRFLEQKTEQILKQPPVSWTKTSDVVPVYNLPGFMISDTLHAALERYPKAPYAVAYFDLNDKRVYSLRSRKGSDVDVEEIAKRFGGGGHKHAAGFSVAMG